MKKIFVLSLVIIGILNMMSVALAEPVLEKTILLPAEEFDIRDNLKIIDPDSVVDPDADAQPEEDGFFHYGPPSPKEIELLRDPYVFEPYMNLLPDPAKILILQRMEKDDEMSPADLKEVPIEIRQQALEQTIRDLKEEENDKPIEPENVPEPQPEEREKNKIESLFTEYWVEFLALVVSVVGLLLGVTGFSMATSKKKKSISQLMNEIDDTFSSFKWKSKRCEAELYRLHDIVDDKLKKGKLDESSYQVLVNRIDKYLSEIKELDIQGSQKDL